MSEQTYQDETTVARRAGFGVEFWQGFRRGLPVMIASAPFGLLFGALAIDNGFTVFEAVLMSAAIFGGASQMVGIELFGHNIPAWLIVFSIFAVNFRHVLYSAAVGRRIGHFTIPESLLSYFLLTDPQYAETEKRAESGVPVTFAWYLGVATPIYVMWVVEAWIGGLFGNLIKDPHALGIDMLLPIYFLGLVMGFRKRSNWAPIVIASGIASIVAAKTIGSPWHVSIGALAGILTAVIVAKPDKTTGEN
ncbi:AzlC family ABC transporter permease [Phyllobacterium calauticae]|jgi:predicted branched-subunit amino acid permease|uniref:AzlC family ABC transporter permease n=1 Tax=Phyllobacterium calauticae TaxID=2817027 RepID=UPI001CBD5E6A|nr:AzlC family ABC transporter permease [Phyllobacterium calauticae]MBZ3692513.1 AzlC family ABC transporter permease [Phyllobacterium calauticae]